MSHWIQVCKTYIFKIKLTLEYQQLYMISLISLMQLNGLMNTQSHLPPQWDWSEVWALDVSFWPNLCHRKTHHTITCLWNWYSLHQQFYARCLSGRIRKTSIRRVFKSLSDCIRTMHWIEAIIVNHYNPIKHRLLGTPHRSGNILPPTCQSHIDLFWWGEKMEKNQHPEIFLYTTKGISWNLQGYVHYHAAALKHAVEHFAPTMWSADMWDWGYLCLFHLLSHSAL